MATDTTGNANNGAKKEGVRALLSPQYTAYLSSGGWGQTQEYLVDALRKVQTHTVAYNAEFPNLKEREAAELKIMQAEAVHSTHDEFGNSSNSVEYNSAYAKLEVVQGRLQELGKPIPLPSQDTLKALHEFAAAADRDFAARNSFIYQLRNWDELNPATQEHFFNRLSSQHKAEYDQTRAEVDKLLAERGGVERILQSREAEKMSAQFAVATPDEPKNAMERYLSGDKQKSLLDEKTVETMHENSLMFFPLEYTPLVKDSPEFHAYVNTVIRENSDSLKQDMYKAQYNIDLARGVYPYIDTNIEAQLAFAQLDIVSGAALGTVSVVAGEAVGVAAIRGASALGTKLIGNGAGKAVSEFGTYLAEKAPLVASVTGKVTGVASPIVFAGGASIAVDEIALEPLMMRSQDGSEMTSAFNTQPLTKKERGEMAEVVMKEGDIPLISPISRILSFNGDFAEKHPDLYIAAGTPIPSACVSLEVKPNTPEAAEIKTRVGAIDSIVKNYTPREAKFWKELNAEIDKLPVLPEEISPVSPTDINNNAIAKSGQSTNIEGR